MKKMILLIFLMLGVLSFSRIVNKCEVITPYSCRSLESGKVFNFNWDMYTFSNETIGNVYRVEFYGEGYEDLTLTDLEYLY